MLFLLLIGIAVVIVFFVVLLLFMKTVLYQQVSKATAHLTEINDDYTQKLEDAKKRTQEADEYYDQTVLKAKSDAEIEKARILKEAHDEEARVVGEARKESNDIIDKAHKARETYLEELEARVAEAAAERAAHLAQRVLPGIITQDLHNAWVESMSQHGFEELDRLNVSREVREAVVTSAHELSAAHKTAIEKKITAKLGREIHFKSEVDPAMIAGVKIKLGSVVIDGSLRHKIREAARHA